MPDEPASRSNPQDDGIPLWAVELGCWTMVALAPFLYWVNGPAVSTDQFVVRTSVVTLALLGGIVIRVLRWRCGRARSGTADKEPCVDEEREAG